MRRQNTQPYLIGIAGGTGSGKTHFVQRVVSIVGRNRSAVIQQDSYYLDLSYMPFSERERVNFDHPSAVDFELLVSHLEELKKGLEVLVPAYDFSTHTRRPTAVSVAPRPLIFVEGIFVLHHEPLRTRFDLKIYLDADSEIRLQRRVSRDLQERGRSKESVMRQYRETVLPMHCKYVEPCRQHADFVFSYEGDSDSSVKTVVSALNRSG
jgi:uridine kinase